MVRDISEVQENRGLSAEIMLRSGKSKMAAKMVADFLENGSIHRISYHNMFYFVFGIKMIILEENRYK